MKLDAEISESIINEMDNDSDIRDRVYKLRRAKDLVRLGFSQVHAPAHRLKKAKQSKWKPYAMALAASVTAVAVSLGSGAFGYFFGKHDYLAINSVASPTAIQQKSDRILLHISESDVNQFAVALNYAEKFLEKSKADGGEIVLVANSGGLDLMRVGVSPFEKKILNMIDKNDNVYFIACANSVRNLRDEGVNFKLINDIKVEKPAIDHIIDYVQKGWTYKKVESLVKI